MTGRKRELCEYEIFDMAETKGLALARHAYQQTYGVEIHDKAIDVKIERALLDYFSESGPLSISAKVVLAIWLRENALRGRGKRKTAEQRLDDGRAVREAKSIKAELMAKGIKADEAADQAAKTVKGQGHTTLSVTEIKYRTTLRKPRPARKRSRGHSAK